MTNEELKEIEARAKRATAGPWTSYLEGRDQDVGDNFIMTGIADDEEDWSEERGPDLYVFGGTEDDQDFIAHARQDIPVLIVEIKRLKEALAAK